MRWRQLPGMFVTALLGCGGGGSPESIPVEYTLRASGEFFVAHAIWIDGVAQDERLNVRFSTSDGLEHVLQILDGDGAGAVVHELVLSPRYCSPSRFDVERQEYEVVEDAVPVTTVLGCRECQAAEIVSQECRQYR